MGETPWTFGIGSDQRGGRLRKVISHRTDVKPLEEIAGQSLGATEEKSTHFFLEESKSERGCSYLAVLRGKPPSFLEAWDNG